jgi:hypothetical protein
VLTDVTKKKSLLSAAIIGVVIVVFSQLVWCADDNVSAQISSGFNSSLKL